MAITNIPNRTLKLSACYDSLVQIESEMRETLARIDQIDVQSPFAKIYMVRLINEYNQLVAKRIDLLENIESIKHLFN